MQTLTKAQFIERFNPTEYKHYGDVSAPYEAKKVQVTFEKNGKVFRRIGILFRDSALLQKRVSSNGLHEAIDLLNTQVKKVKVLKQLIVYVY